MRAHGWTDAVTVGIVTDFTVHPLWEEARDLDYYVTPSELLDFQMARKGLDISKILPFGIPIRPQFSRKTNRAESRHMLGLDTDLPTILLMSGSMGYGSIDISTEKLDALPLDMQVVVVCGNNKEMYRKIKRKKFKKRFDVYGYVDHVDLMMDAADCIITKPGGITSSEALAKGLPMIMVNPIPGHETRNAEFMLNNGIALYATNSFPLEEAVFSLFKHPDRLEDLRATIALYAKHNAARKLCEFLVNIAEDGADARNEG
jgi:processive 1,2-diacylglycerol beta-glucosyltransferase